EGWIDRRERDLPPLRRFILPGGTPLAAELHRARTVCRRAERRLVALAQQESVEPRLVRYLNRLGDLLFVLARWCNHRGGGEEIEGSGGESERYPAREKNRRPEDKAAAHPHGGEAAAREVTGTVPDGRSAGGLPPRALLAAAVPRNGSRARTVPDGSGGARRGGHRPPLRVAGLRPPPPPDPPPPRAP